ncbi:molybdopterin cofactor-binding domain-containing protein [Rhizobium sp. LCM 4573]|uniref:xanthine dehydrogenase family protein molybdopterin-binding subunit n=1 Tax=Rhizobium sp. LCM 4573 TaxID=1848291 RepID=UPI0008DB1E02|nr:molybdopterin cofactor-binding domain-containing protein [Rhizobium sp. LCM 4573]OHV77258.1 hypothetical protein LCM4573_10900 [Rhizobium sp. LCM 4573]
MSDLSRRVFMLGSGALAVAISMLGSAPARARQSLNERIEIHADGTIRLRVGRIEMGQGFNSAMAQLAAEELDVDIARIRILPVDTAISPNEGFTDSSASIRSSGMAVRRAAAEARAMLLGTAARRLSAPLSTLRVDDGTVRSATGSISYWALVAEGSLVTTAPPRLKATADRRLVGHDMPRIDLPAKVMGKAVFLHDLRLPGMLHARVLRPPSYEARLASLDSALLSAMPDVRLIRNGSFLAVVAECEEEAVRALERLRSSATWRESETMPEPGDLYAYLRREANVPELSPSSSRARLSATYEVPYRMHGSIGPSCAIAFFEDGNLTVWSHAQGMYPLRSSLADLVDLPQEHIRCIHMEGAGCYGHNGADDAAADAALIARAIPGRAIRLQWMREDEHLWEPYGPAMVAQVSGRVENGRIRDWGYIVASPAHSSRPGGATRLLAARHVEPPIAPSFLAGFTQWAGGGSYNAEPYYDIPAQVDVRFVRRAPLRSSALRGLGAFANVFAIESFMDELAAEAGIDPVTFRLDHLSDPRARLVIETVADHFGWSRFTEQAGRGKGFGFARLNNYGAYVAVAVEMERDANGRFEIIRAVAAVDCGEVVSPDGVRNQIEGGIVQAASWVLMEKVDFDRTRVTSADWDAYPILRITEAPEVEVNLIDRPGQPPLGVGEAAQGPAGAAVANAAASIGPRIRSLPLNR